jgi:AhpD family alkylhydroperoxidase
MTARIDLRQYLATTPLQGMLNLGKTNDIAPLEQSLIELVRLRTSQINGCAYCIDMHTKDARAIGETEQRLYGLSAWHETPFFSERERAALEWTEAVANVAATHLPDDVYERVRVHFDERELVALTCAVVATNGWNRLVLACRVPAGTYQPQAVHA